LHKGCALCAKIAKKFAFGEQTFVEKVEGAIHVNECIVGDANNDVVAIARREGNVYHMTFTEVCDANSSDLCIHVRRRWVINMRQNGATMRKS
jgi:hypothetical protein